MTDLSTAPTDREVVDRLLTEHGELVNHLDRLTTDLMAATRGVEGRHLELVRWVHDVLLPHAKEEEATTYAAAARLPGGAPLVDGMVREHKLILQLANAVDGAWSSEASAGFARALYLVFRSHQEKENEIIIPMLLDAGVSLAEVVGSHHH